MLKKLFSGVILSSLICLSANAKNYYMKFNEKSSNIKFLVSTTLHDVNAEVQKFKGSISITADDNNNVQKAEGTLELTVDSFFSNDKKRDARMKNEILSVAKYPLIKFKINSVKVTEKLKDDGSMKMNLIGPLTILGTSKNVEIPVKVKLDKNKTNAVVEGSYKLNFKDYNVPDPSIPLLNKVNENINITFNLKAN
ncbi:MAG: YceI family protein [Candidatus Sericytochromatia bacterium]